MAKMPHELVGPDKARLSRGAQEHDADVFADRPDGPEGRRRPCSPCSASRRRRWRKANIDLSKTYTNKFVEAARRRIDSGFNRSSARS